MVVEESPRSWGLEMTEMFPKDGHNVVKRSEAWHLSVLVKLIVSINPLYSIIRNVKSCWIILWEDFYLFMWGRVGSPKVWVSLPRGTSIRSQHIYHIYSSQNSAPKEKTNSFGWAQSAHLNKDSVADWLLPPVLGSWTFRSCKMQCWQTRLCNVPDALAIWVTQHHPKFPAVQPKPAKTFNSRTATVSDTNLFTCLPQTNRKN